MKLAQKIFLFLILILMAGFYFFRLQSTSRLDIPENTTITIRGRITQQPYLKDSYQIIYLGPILIKTDRFPGYFYGDELVITGRFKKRVINYFQTQYFASFPTIRLVKSEEKDLKKLNLRFFLLDIRGYIERSVESFLPEPQSSLLLGIIFGTKRQMPQELLKNLRKTGTIHIVVASGQNISMLIKFLMAGLILVVNRRKAVFLSIFVIFLYILMVGGEAPVIRAGIMGALTYSAQVFGREEDGTIALMFAAIIMLLVSPLILFDIGFQLSFAATAGILWFYPLLKRKKFFSLPVLGEGLATTLAAQIGVLPILLKNFGQVSFFSPLINALVNWIVPEIMVLGLVLVPLILFLAPLAKLLGWFVWLLLTYFLRIVEIGAKFPLAAFEVKEVSNWWAVTYYLILILILFRFGYKKKFFDISDTNEEINR